MENQKYYCFYIANPQDYLKSLSINMKQHLEFEALSPSKIDLNTGEVIQYLIVVKDSTFVAQ